MAAQPTLRDGSSGWGRQPASSAPCWAGRQPPPPGNPTGDPEGVAHAIADSQLWVPDHLAIVLGLILVLGGLVAIARSIHGGLPGALARLGSVAAVAGVTVGLILVTSTGLAAKQLAEAWATAPPQEQAAALRLVLAEETINFALAPCSTSVRRRDLHPLRPSRGLEPALPTLAGTG
jgi:hypothetical protein